MRLLIVLSLVAACEALRHGHRDAQASFDIGNPNTPLDQGRVYIPSHQPLFAQLLSPHLTSMSIEMDRWPDWAGHKVGKPNKFVNSALGNIANRTGAQVWLRVGANSQDRALLNMTNRVANHVYPPVTPVTPHPEAIYNGIGRDWYALSQNLPDGTPFTWGLNLRSQNKSETVAQAKLLADTFQGSRRREMSKVSLRLVQIGNEPDAYRDVGVPLDHQTPYETTWNPVNYTETWLEYVAAVAEVIDTSRVKFQPGAFSASTEAWKAWNAMAVLNAGLLDDPKMRRLIGSWSAHHYNGAYGYGQPAAPGQMMNKRNVREWLAPRVNDIWTIKPTGLEFVWGEANSYANHGVPGISDTVEEAIWGTDFMLYSASLGVSRCHMQDGVGYRYNLIQPVGGYEDGSGIMDRPHIMPLYYAFLIVAEAVGNSGHSVIAELGTTNISAPVAEAENGLAAYGIWERGVIKRVVLINSVPYLPDRRGSSRTSINVSLTNWKEGNATVKYLDTPTTDAHHGIYWAGQDFDTHDAKPKGEIQTWEMDGDSVLVPASSVALVIFD